MMASASSTAVQSGEPQVVCLDGQLLCVEAVRLSLAWCACVFPCAAAVVDRRRRPCLVVAYHHPWSGIRVLVCVHFTGSH
jgi:hypothetical protein